MGSSKPKVVIDAGHGGADPGAMGRRLREKDVVLAVTLKAAALLRQAGVEVFLTRDGDEYLSLGQRRTITNREDPDLFLSIHANAGGGHGFEVFTTRGKTAADPYAERLFQGYALAFPDRKGRADKVDGDSDKERNFAVLLCTAPAALFELGFIDTAEGEAFLANEGNQDTMAEALATATFDHLQALGKIGDPPSSSDEIPTTKDPHSEVATVHQWRAEIKDLLERMEEAARIQEGPAKHNYLLSYTHLEDARMRLGKVLADLGE